MKRSSLHDRRAVRILGLLKTLVESGRPTVLQHAARFKVHRETIYRTALEAIGYPNFRDQSGRLSRPRCGRHSRLLRSRAHDP